MIRFSHEANSWQRSIYTRTLMKWVKCSADEAREYIDKGAILRVDLCN